MGHASLVGLLDLVDDVLVSAADATLRIWDAKTGELRSKLRDMEPLLPVLNMMDYVLLVEVRKC